MTAYDFQCEYGIWADTVFGTNRKEPIVKHLKREVLELEELHAPEEAADCLLLLLHHAHQEDYDLFDEARNKYKRLLTRTWKAPDEEGVIEHVKGREE